MATAVQQLGNAFAPDNLSEPWAYCARVDSIEARISQLVERPIDAMLEKSGRGELMDFVVGFAIPLPVAVTAAEIGMEGNTDLATVKCWSDAFGDQLARFTRSPGSTLKYPPNILLRGVCSLPAVLEARR